MPLLGPTTSHLLERKQVLQANEATWCWDSDETSALSQTSVLWCPLSPLCLYEARKKEGRRARRKEWCKETEKMSWSEIDIPGIDVINLLFISSTLWESKHCEKPDLREATEWNCTLGTNCINEILVTDWILLMLLLSQPHTGLVHSSYDAEESPVSGISSTQVINLRIVDPLTLQEARWRVDDHLPRPSSS